MRDIAVGRAAVDNYRAAHLALHQSGGAELPAKHTPLLQRMLGELAAEDFSSLEDFFISNNRQNAIALGFVDKKALDDELNRLMVAGRIAEERALKSSFEEMWH